MDMAKRLLMLLLVVRGWRRAAIENMAEDPENEKECTRSCDTDHNIETAKGINLMTRPGGY